MNNLKGVDSSMFSREWPKASIIVEWDTWELKRDIGKCWISKYLLYVRRIFLTLAWKVPEFLSGVGGDGGAVGGTENGVVDINLFFLGKKSKIFVCFLEAAREAVWGGVLLYGTGLETA
jgi:hypothetical protein